MDKEKKLSRRRFIKSVAAGAFLFSLPPNILENIPVEGKSAPLLPGSGEKSRVVIVHNPSSVDDNGRINEKELPLMLEAGIKELTGKADLASAWESLFAQLNSTDGIGIKVNSVINKTHLGTHPQLAMALALQLSAIGVAQEHIIIWERKNQELNLAGYSFNKGDRGIQIYGTDTEEVGYDEEITVLVSGSRLRLSRILTSHIQHLINLPVLKDHSISGVTLSLKNHYGSIPLGDNMSIARPYIKAMHQNHCNPQIAQLNTAPALKDKSRLIIIDALMGVYDGGPDTLPQWTYRSLIMATDPVACDLQGRTVIERKRKEMGLPSIMPKVGHIEAAAKKGLGIAQPQMIDLRRINL